MKYVHQTAEPSSRDPLPDRPGRNVHPTAIKPKRRTTQEVAAEREAQRRAVEEKIQELEAVKQRLAEMNASEDNYDDELDNENPQRLSAVMRKRAYDEVEENSDGKAFEFAEVDAMESSDAETPAKEKIVSDVRNLTRAEG